MAKMKATKFQPPTVTTAKDFTKDKHKAKEKELFFYVIAL
jgi:hypothetical protein